MCSWVICPSMTQYDSPWAVHCNLEAYLQRQWCLFPGGDLEWKGKQRYIDAISSFQQPRVKAQDNSVQCWTTILFSFPKNPDSSNHHQFSSLYYHFFFQKEILGHISKCGISEAPVKWEIKNRKMHLQWSLNILFQSILKIRLWRQSFFQIEKCDFTVKWKNEVFLSEIPIFSLCVKGSEQEVG